MAHGRTTVIAAVLALVVAGGCGLTGSHDKVAAGPGAAAETTEPAVEPTTETPETPSPTPSRTPSKKPTKKATKKPTRAVATQDPFWDQLPDCAHYDSTKPIAKSKVKTALKAASTRVYWRTEAPQLRLNYPLVKAVAWQESGWKSNIHNCDGGTGVMQVMPGTVDQINNRFGLSYDPAKYQDNAYVGANYLAWLTKWAGDRYFGGSYSLSTGKCKPHTSWCLLNVVISGYNAGQGGLEAAEGAKKLPNPQYVGAVRALMTRCQCDQY
jgi:soluble lytic murein transglycosylase-like protein